MAIGIKSITTATNNGSSATISVTTSESPSTTQVGDLVIVIHGNDFYALSNMGTPTATGSPTMNSIVNADGGTNEGHLKCWYYIANTGGAQTVSVTETGAHDEEKSLAVYVLSGADTSGSPIDGTPASNSSSSGTSSQVCNSVSPTNADSFCIQALTSGAGAAAGSYTAPGGTTKQYDIRVSTFMSAAGGTKQLVSSGATGTFTWTTDVPVPYASATFAIKTAATSGSSAPPALVIPARGTPTRVGPAVVRPTIGPSQVIRLAPGAVVQNLRPRPGPFPIALKPPFLSAQVTRPPIWVAPQAPPPPPRMPAVSAAQFPGVVAAGILRSTPVVVAEQFRPSVTAPVVLTPPPLPQSLAPVVVVTSTWRPAATQIVVAQAQFPAVAGILSPATLVVPTFVRPGPAPVRTSAPSYLPGPAINPAVLVVPGYRQPVPSAVAVLQPAFMGAADCHLPRPGSGETLRPTGTTLRPTGTTARPGSGPTLRPDSGQTPNPC